MRFAWITALRGLARFLNHLAWKYSFYIVLLVVAHAIAVVVHQLAYLFWTP